MSLGASQLNLNAVSFKPCALDQSCFSRVTYLIIICDADVALHFELILVLEKLAYLGLLGM